MSSRLILLVLFACLLLIVAPAHAQSSTDLPTASTASPPIVTSTAASQTSSSQATSTGTPPDVLLNVPNLSVGRIELDVDNLQADINLHAEVASLVSINAGVAVSVQKINLTITDVKAELELIVRLGHLVEIVNRVFESLDLNPLLITALNNVTSVLETVVGAVDGLLGSVTQGGTTLSFLVDNLGNIVQQVVGADGIPLSSIVGNYLTNMTYTGVSQTLGNELVQKTYSYSPLSALVNIVFNSLGQVVQATVVKETGGSTSSTRGSPLAQAQAR
ncbi:hypothetical protein BZG36_05549 [Bifiguratus adelaidae]|uniref:Uncharacterized protein n=1 Tax=Bifiguratus adelaidae TaxID=1938954 RepID=A0A261XUJ8_9FUNG|nr:hypothetical protein BZG36_05549 [Bifiguratus adelaidae]